MNKIYSNEIKEIIRDMSYEDCVKYKEIIYMLDKVIEKLEATK